MFAEKGRRLINTQFIITEGIKNYSVLENDFHEEECHQKDDVVKATNQHTIYYHRRYQKL